jgi:uncharacterized 2Fe-2S/4Fe-4S cluster protein (DUF4445 family)
MIHFLLNLDSRRIRREPYVASAAFVPPIRAAEAGIKINKRGLLYCLPAVAAFVGSDIVAGVLATRLYTRRGINLFVDVGTNGEVVLGNRDWMVCASSSAGPAFEGSGVLCGMRAQAGAIERLSFGADGRIDYGTVGGAPPIGLCGSGLLDVLAGLFSAGVIDRTGKFVDLPRTSPWYGMLGEGQEGPQFELVPARTADTGPIVITQADIDNLIRSKAGVFAAIRVLMNATQTRIPMIENVYIAGGFGNFLNMESAITVGMLPEIEPEKLLFAGNTSITGTKTSLFSVKAFETAEKIAENMTYIDLMSHAPYMEEFVRARFLPHTDLSLFPSSAAASAAGESN